MAQSSHFLVLRLDSTHKLLKANCVVEIDFSRSQFSLLTIFLKRFRESLSFERAHVGESKENA
jgi:hypothetical protein